MRTPRFILALSAVIACLGQAHAKDGGGHETGGGTLVRIDGGYSISDRFFIGVGQEHGFDDLPKDVTDEIGNIQAFLEAYGLTNSKFWSQNVRGSRAAYVPLEPWQQGKAPCSADVTTFGRHGCTSSSGVTYLFLDSLREQTPKIQAIAVIEQRLKTITNDEVAIDRFTSALAHPFLMSRYPDDISNLRVAAIRIGFHAGRTPPRTQVPANPSESTLLDLHHWDKPLLGLGDERGFAGLPRSIKNELQKAQNVLTRFGWVHPSFWSENVRGSEASYVFLEPWQEPHAPCTRYQPPMRLTVDEFVHFGCTPPGRVSYLFLGPLRLIGPRERAIAVIHERLWTLRPMPSHDTIARFTSALDWLLTEADRTFSFKPQNDRTWWPQLERAARLLGFKRIPAADFQR